ncbi:MAG TPA: hypothetical protein VGI73_05415 [Solirubrobacterales bacterium]|jgi:hypothetical protein
MRKLKHLATAIAMIGVIGAISATSAFAEYHIASVSGGTITGSQVSPIQIVTKVGIVKCSVLDWSGLQEKETEAVLPLHATCTSGGTLAGVKASITTTFCGFLFEKPETEPAPTHAKVTIVCSGAMIVIETVGVTCKVEIGAQGPLSKVTFTNEASGKVTATFAVSGIAYSYTGSCPSANGVGGNASNGTMSGSLLLSTTAEFTVT